MTTPIRVTGTYEDGDYSVDIWPGDIWPTDRTPTSSRVAAIVLCSKGLTYAPAPSCGSVVLDLADPKTVLACLVNETKILSITPPTQFVPSASGPPGSADGPSDAASPAADFTRGLSLLSKFDPAQRRDEHGRWLRSGGPVTSPLGRTTVTHIPYDQGPPQSIREMIREAGGLRNMVRTDLAILARDIAAIVTGGTAGIKTADDSLEARVLAWLETLAAQDADLTDPDTFNALINDLRSDTPGDD